MSKPGAPSGEIRSLNTVRGIAALMVAVYHAPAIFGVTRTLPHAYLAVDLFFVLSGFVIAHAYGGRIAGGMGARRFSQLRLARLYPLLFLATLAGFAFWGLKVATGRVDFNIASVFALPLNLLLLPAGSSAAADGAAYPFVVQSWSIVWEVALCLAFFAWTKWIKRGAWLIAAAAAVSLAVVAHARGSIDGGWTADSFWVGGLRALSAFWAGVTVHQFVSGRTAISRRAGLGVLALAACVLVYACAVAQTWWLADYACVAIGYPAIIAGVALTRHRLLENRLGDRLGEASYSVYLLHGLTIDVLATALKAAPPLSGPAYLALGAGWVVVLVCGSWVCWKLVETPLRVFFSRTSEKRGWRFGMARVEALRAG